MTTTTLDLEDPAVLDQLGAQWKFGSGWNPDEPNEGLVAQASDSPARLPDYDDSRWETIDDLEAGGQGKPSGGPENPGIRKKRSEGLTFGWYRIAVPIPETIGDFRVEGSAVWFETNIDDYGEIWIDGEWGPRRGSGQRIQRHQPRQGYGRRQARNDSHHSVLVRQWSARPSGRRNLHALRPPRLREMRR